MKLMNKRIPVPAFLDEGHLDLIPQGIRRVGDGPGPEMLVSAGREEGVRLVDPSPRRVGFGRDLIERAPRCEPGDRTELAFGQVGVSRRISTPLQFEGGLP